MSIPIYLITMSDERRDETLAELSKTNVLHRVTIVNGVDGKEHRNDERLSLFCQKFCTDRIIGCALAHYNAIQQMHQDGHEYALILEDDILIKNPDTFITDLNVVIDQYSSQKWDFISLFCQGICSEFFSNRIGNGSTAAYLVSSRVVEKINSQKISYHADYIRQNENFDTHIGTELFTTRDKRSTAVLGKQDVNFWLHQEIIKLGSMRVQVYHMIAVYIIIFCILRKWKDKIHSNVHLNVSTLMTVIPLTFIHYMTYETQYYRCSPKTLIIAIVFSLCLIGGHFHIQNNTAKTCLLFPAYATLTFHYLYALDTRK